MATSKLSVLVLPHLSIPPSFQIHNLAFQTDRGNLGETLLSLIDESNALPIVAAIPTTSGSLNSGEEPSLSEWGTAARVLRVVKPPARNPQQPYLVSRHGFTRVKLIHSKPSTNHLMCMPMHDVEYPPPLEQVPSLEAVVKFKQAHCGSLTS